MPLASIAHEINQPLTGIVANTGTVLRYLAAPTPSLEEARQHLGLIVRDGRRAAEIIGRIRTLVKKDIRPLYPGIIPSPFAHNCALFRPMISSHH
jgi:signal transduction histidine kinase